MRARLSGTIRCICLAHGGKYPSDSFDGIFRGLQVVFEMLPDTVTPDIGDKRTLHPLHRVRYRYQDRSANLQGVFDILTGNQRLASLVQVQTNHQRSSGNIEEWHVAHMSDLREGAIRKSRLQFNRILS